MCANAAGTAAWADESYTLGGDFSGIAGDFNSEARCTFTLAPKHAFSMPPAFKMLTKYITSVSASFSPFNARSGKTARNFLALLPPNARSTMAIDLKMGGRNASAQPASLALKFSMYGTVFLG